LITLLAGLFGILFGAFLSWIVTLVATKAGLAWTFTLPFYAIGIGFGVSAVIGIGFGREFRVGDGEDDVLARLDGEPIMVRQGHDLALTFHPELASDLRIHNYFLMLY